MLWNILLPLVVDCLVWFLGSSSSQHSSSVFLLFFSVSVESLILRTNFICRCELTRRDVDKMLSFLILTKCFWHRDWDNIRMVWSKYYFCYVQNKFAFILTALNCQIMSHPSGLHVTDFESTLYIYHILNFRHIIQWLLTIWILM